MFLTEPIPAGKPSPYPRNKRIYGYGSFGLLGFTPLQRDADQIRPVVVWCALRDRSRYSGHTGFRPFPLPRWEYPR